MKDFANRKKTKLRNNKNKQAFGSKKSKDNSISKNTIIYLFSLSIFIAFISFFYFGTEVTSIKPKSAMNSVTIDFPSSLKEDRIIVGEDDVINLSSCEFFVQIGAYGNRKYAIEAQDFLKSEIQDISINEVYSSLYPGKLLHSVISGPYENKSSANNSKEKITRKGFDPQLRTICKQI